MIRTLSDLIKSCRDGEGDNVIEGCEDLENVVIKQALNHENGCSKKHHKAIEIEFMEHHFNRSNAVECIACSSYDSGRTKKLKYSVMSIFGNVFLRYKLRRDLHTEEALTEDRTLEEELNASFPYTCSSATAKSASYILFNDNARIVNDKSYRLNGNTVGVCVEISEYYDQKSRNAEGRAQNHTTCHNAPSVKCGKNQTENEISRTDKSGVSGGGCYTCYPNDDCRYKRKSRSFPLHKSIEINRNKSSNMEAYEGAYAVARDNFVTVKSAVHDNSVDEIYFRHMGDQYPRGKKGYKGEILRHLAGIFLSDAEVNYNIKEEVHHHHQRRPNKIHNPVIGVQNTVEKHTHGHYTERYEKGCFRHGCMAEYLISHDVGAKRDEQYNYRAEKNVGAIARSVVI